MQAIRTMREQALSLALFALLPLAAVSIEGRLPAQDPPVPPRTEFVVHYYVSSPYGDNSQAFILNPTRNRFLAPHGTGPTQILGVLQHAPYSFQTLTGAQGAVAHINAQFPTLPTTLTNGNTVRAVVIHCEPGLYGPRTQGLTKEIDPQSGLPWNGEVFPVKLPNGVSIQGTSALDTIFDGRGDEGFTSYIFLAQKPAQGVPYGEASHKKSFIAHITIRGAWSGEGAGAPNGAGIFIDGSEGPVDLLVHNCFIVENTVGIAIAHLFGSEQPPASPAIVNNTIAWNTIGIWSGFSNFNLDTHTGQSLPRVHNNLIDPFHPSDRTSGGSGYSAFEGLHRDDLEIDLTPTGGTRTWSTFNAWEGPASASAPALPYGWANLGIIATGWPQTAPRTAITGTITGLVDISPITFGKASTPVLRGTLFINDLLRNHAGSDLSPHDFRLSVYTSGQNTSIGILVDQGASPGSFPGTGLVFRNLRAITIGNGWGLTTGSGNAYDLDVAQMNVGAWDGEGFGNVRSYLRQGWTSGTYSNIDLGADDLGDLIMGGFIPWTRIFSMNVPNALGISNHQWIYFVDAPNRVYPTSQALRPLANSWVGQSWSGIDNSWWKQIQNNPNPPAPPLQLTNYTEGVIGSVRRTVLDPYRPPFMRNLQCDFAPHLLLHINPMWPTQLDLMFPTSPPSQIGIYASNPWFDGVVITGYTGVFPDNPFLYYNPSNPPPGGSPINTKTYVQAGILSSPGSYLGLTNGDFLEPSLSQTQFGPFGGGPPRNYYQTNTVGLGDSIALDTILNTGDLGMRVNCQVKYSTNPEVWSNLQTFLEIYVNPTIEKSKEAAGKVPRPTRKAQEEMLKKILKRYRR